MGTGGNAPLAPQSGGAKSRKRLTSPERWELKQMMAASAMSTVGRVSVFFYERRVLVTYRYMVVKRNIFTEDYRKKFSSSLLLALEFKTVLAP